MKRWAASLALLTLTAATVAPLPNWGMPHIARWVVVGQDRPSETVTLRRAVPIEFGILAPDGPLRIEQDAIVGREIAISRGTLMVPVDSGVATICEFSRDVGSAFDCLSDTDDDGKFDARFGTQVFNEIFLGSIGDDGGFERLAHPISVAPATGLADIPEVRLEIDYRGYSKNVLTFRTCFSVRREKIIFGRDLADSDKNRSRSCEKKFSKISILKFPFETEVYGQKLKFSNAGRDLAEIEMSPSRENFVFTSSFSPL